MLFGSVSALNVQLTLTKQIVKYYELWYLERGDTSYDRVFNRHINDVDGGSGKAIRRKMSYKSR